MAINLGLGLGLVRVGGAKRAFDPASLWSSTAGSLYEAVAGNVFTTSVFSTATVAGNSVGGVYDKAKSLVYGENEFDGFSSIGTWVDNGNGSWSIDGTQVANQDLNGDISGAELTARSGKFYETSFTVSGLGPSQSIIVYGLNASPIFFGNGTHKVLLNVNSAFFKFRAASSVTATVSGISLRELPGDHAIQSSASQRPVLTDVGGNPGLDFDLTDDALVSTYATGFTGEMFLVTRTLGVTRYGFTISNGQTHSLGRYMPNSDVIAWGTRAGTMTDAQYAELRSHYQARGASGDFSGVTNFSSYWRDWNRITSFPLIDTSSGTSFNLAWFGCSSLTSFPLIDTSSVTSFNLAWSGCSSLASFPLINTSSGTSFHLAWANCSSLTSFPLIDTSSGTHFSSTWSGCSSLTSFPSNFFDGCLATNFINAFTNTNLSQASIDAILVSINSNGTSSGTFNQSGGSAPSATGNAAIDALRSRGWTVTVTGGY